MTGATFFELLGLSREQSQEIARRVKDSLSKSDSPEEWIGMLVEEFGIDQNSIDAFASGWFAGRYAGVSEVFNVVQRELDTVEKDKAEKKEMESRYTALDGYA